MNLLKSILIATFLIVLNNIYSQQIEPKGKWFGMKSLPSQWVRLTPKDKSYIQYVPCDARNQKVSIISDGIKSEVFYQGSTEDERFKILEAYSVEGDTVVMETNIGGGTDVFYFKFIWVNKRKKLARWITIYPGGEVRDYLFVAAEKMKRYPVVDQPCSECWEDCD